MPHHSYRPTFRPCPQPHSRCDGAAAAGIVDGGEVVDGAGATVADVGGVGAAVGPGAAAADMGGKGLAEG